MLVSSKQLAAISWLFWNFAWAIFCIK